MRLVFLGPPGAGKGTQAVGIAQHFAIPHVSTGNLFRQNLKAGTPLGLQAQRYLDQGELVPDQVTEAMVADRLALPDAARGFVLDGFPRNLRQGQTLAHMLSEGGRVLTRAIVLDVPETVLVNRLTGRRVCPACQATYHLEFSPPAVAGVCDRCGSALIQRSDDTVETVARRLAVYQEETAPLVQFYEERGLLSRVRGTGTVDEVTARILESLS